PGFGRKSGRELGAQNADGRGGDDGHEPAAVDAVGQAGLDLLNGEDGEDAVGERGQEDGAQGPEGSGAGPGMADEKDLAAEDAGGCDGREKPDGAAVVKE